jgi:hypothetical protein
VRDASCVTRWAKNGPDTLTFCVYLDQKQPIGVGR